MTKTVQTVQNDAKPRHSLTIWERKSKGLQILLRALGFRKGNGVSRKGLEYADKIARQHGLTAWPWIKTPKEYDQLTDAIIWEQIQ